MFSKKNKKNIVTIEARQILLNQVDMADNGHLVALNEWKIKGWGAADGAQKVRALGVKKKSFFYNTVHINNTKAIYEAGKIMNSIGRMVDFQTKKDSVASLVKLYIFYPTVLLFFENEDKTLQLDVFTARSLTSGLAVFFSRKRFEKEMKEFLERDKTKKAAKDTGNEKGEEEIIETDGLKTADSDDDEEDESGIKKLFKKKKAVVYVPYDFDEDGEDSDEDDEPELAEDEEEYWDGRNWVIRKKDEDD